MSKIYLVSDRDDRTIEAIFFSEELADEFRNGLVGARYYEVIEFETNDDPVVNEPNNE